MNKTFLKLLKLLINWTDRPFPLIERVHVKIIYSLFFGMFIGFFILLFKPFGFYNFNEEFILKLSFVFGISSSASLLFASFIVPSLFPDYFVKEDWNIGRQIIFLMVFFTLFTISNWICYMKFDIGKFIQYAPSSIVWKSFLLGLMPSTLYILTIEHRHFRKIQKEHKYALAPREKINHDIHLYSSNKKNKYSFSSADIVCLKGCGNYFIVFYEYNGKIKQQVIRNTMISAEEILHKKKFLRCHKSYIFNCDKIYSLKGNLKALKIQTTIPDFCIPISRNISKEDYQYLLKMAKNNNKIERSA